MKARLGIISLWVVALGGVAALVYLVSLVGGPPRRPLIEAAVPADTVRGVYFPPAEGWKVLDQLSAHHVLVLEVETERMGEVKAIAQQLVQPVADRYSEVLIYFYRPRQRGKLAARRVQWTPKRDYVVVNYEGREK